MIPTASKCRLWYLLVTELGEPYEEVDVSQITLPVGSSLVDEFRKVVVSENHKILSSFTASQLRVYRDMTWFRSRRESPLSPDKCLIDMGTDVMNHLVVVVPSKPSNTLFYARSLTVSRNEFYTTLKNVTTEGDIMTFSTDIPRTNVRRLFIRECFRTIAKSILDGPNLSMIVGTAGVGKRFFTLYLACVLVAQKKRVLLYLHTTMPRAIYWDAYGVAYEYSGKVPDATDTKFWTSDLWCLNGNFWVSEDEMNSSLVEKSHFVFVSSRRMCVQRLTNYRFIPPWTESELEQIAYLYPNVSDWIDRYRVLGGIPSVVFKRGPSVSFNDARFCPEDTAMTIVEKACRQCTLDDLVLEMHKLADQKHLAVHQLVHIMSCHPYTEARSIYASKTVLEVIHKMRRDNVIDSIETVSKKCGQNSLAATLVERVLEPLVEEEVKTGGTFPYYSIRDFNQQPLEEIVIPPKLQNSNYSFTCRSRCPLDFEWLPGCGGCLMDGNRVFWILIESQHKHTSKQFESHYAIVVPDPDFSS